MIFSSLQYLLFLPVVALLYWRVQGTARLVLVVVASYVFYMSWLPMYGALLIALTTANWLLGLGLDAARSRGKTGLLNGLMWFGVAGNLSCLCYYKYTNFFLSNALMAFNKAMHVALPETAAAPDWVNLNIVLPLGISFFVFEFIHYIVDVFRGGKPVKSWLEFTAFAAFFPSQIAGPIKRYQEFLAELRQPMPLNWDRFGEAGTLIMQGLFKKVAIADPINSLIVLCYSPYHLNSAPDAWLASVGFFIQVYCDFSGYTDMGRGSALLLGIRLPENFALPYLSRDITDFWRRWHMSLSFWLRDYCYIPLGGNRHGLLMSWRNSFLTMVACGLWHGADWHYVLFGCLQGVALIVNRQWKDFLERNKPLGNLCETRVMYGIDIILTAAFVTATYTIFRAPDVSTAFHIFGSWFSADMTSEVWEPTLKSGVLATLVVYIGFWLITETVKRRLPHGADITRPVYPAPLRYAAWTAAVLLVIAARPTTTSPFVYFQF